MYMIILPKNRCLACHQSIMSTEKTFVFHPSVVLDKNLTYIIMFSQNMSQIMCIILRRSDIEHRIIIDHVNIDMAKRMIPVGGTCQPIQCTVRNHGDHSLTIVSIIIRHRNGISYPTDDKRQLSILFHSVKKIIKRIVIGNKKEKNSIGVTFSRFM